MLKGLQNQYHSLVSHSTCTLLVLKARSHWLAIWRRMISAYYGVPLVCPWRTRRVLVWRRMTHIFISLHTPSHWDQAFSKDKYLVTVVLDLYADTNMSSMRINCSSYQGYVCMCFRCPFLEILIRACILNCWYTDVFVSIENNLKMPF